MAFCALRKAKGMDINMKFSGKLWCCIIVAEIVMICSLGFIHSRQTTRSINFTQDDLSYNTGESGFYLDKSFDSPKSIKTPNFTLPKGIYTIEVRYECLNSSMKSIDFRYADALYESYLLQKIDNQGEPAAICDFYVKYANRPMLVSGRLSTNATEEDYLLIRNISITPSPLDIRYFVFRLMAMLLFADLLLLLYSIRNSLHISNETRDHLLVLLLLIFISSIPLMSNYLMEGDDLRFHLMRIEGLKTALVYGMFPVRIQQAWLNGHGYAASVFYGDVLLYIPALLRIFGLSVQNAYKFYVLLIQTMTVFIAYYCFRKIGRGAKAGLICTIVYTLNIYRLICIYNRAAVGEYTAMTFLPLIVYGLWNIYTIPEESKEHHKSWMPVTIGCCGVFFSHMITTEMTALFILLTVIVLWKKTFRKKTFLALLKAAASTTLLTCWFLVPFLDYMLNGTYVVNSDLYEPYRLENSGAFLAQLFMVDFSAVAGSLPESEGMASEMPLTVGFSSLFVLVGWLFLYLGKESDKSEKKTGYFTVFLCIFSLWMATNLFPYTWLTEKFPVLQRPAASLQFPWRFLTIAGMMLAFLLCLILQKEWIGAKKRQMFAVLLIMLSVGQSISYMSKWLNESALIRLYQSESVSTSSIGSGEYLPLDADQLKLIGNKYVNQLTYDNTEVTVEEWHREEDAVEVSLTNNKNDTVQIEVPLLLYKGYHAVTDGGEELVISSGTVSRIAVSVPARFTGSFRVQFKVPWYWRLCEIISLLTVVSLVLYRIFIYYSGKTRIK